MELRTGVLLTHGITNGEITATLTSFVDLTIADFKVALCPSLCRVHKLNK
jgi:hypothetical protein